MEDKISSQYGMLFVKMKEILKDDTKWFRKEKTQTERYCKVHVSSP